MVGVRDDGQEKGEVRDGRPSDGPIKGWSKRQWAKITVL